MKRMMALVLGLLLAAPVALAQKPEGTTSCSELRKQGKKCKDLVIDGSEIDGKVVWPEGAVLTGVNRPDHSSLIKLRRTFVDKIVASTADL